MKATWTAQIASFCSALVAIVCPLCLPALGAFLATVGLGFALNVGFLKSLLVVLLALAVGSLAWSAKLHKHWWVVLVGVIGAGLIYTGRYLWFSPVLMWGGAILMLGISVLNFRIKSECKRCQ